MPSKKTTAEIVAIALREMESWPSSWMGDKEDLVAGRAFLPLMRSFDEDLATAKLSPRAAKKHVDNLWLLGGELVRELYVDPGRREDPVAYLMETLSVEEGSRGLLDSVTHSTSQPPTASAPAAVRQGLLFAVAVDESPRR